MSRLVGIFRGGLVTDTPSDNSIVMLGDGEYTSLAIADNGRFYCWGSDYFGTCALH